MYCSGCGTEVTGELNYCNRCGTSLNASASVPAPSIAPMSFTKLTIIIGITFIVGMGVVFGGVGELLRKGIAEPAVVLLAIFGLAGLFGTSAMIIRLWSKMAGLSPQQPQRPALPNRQQFISEPTRAAQLPPRPTNFGSVTEHTTRTFEPVLQDSVEKKK